jgi:hypothetical protein
MVQYIIINAPILLILLLYFIRLERRLTKIETNLEWIQKNINSCRQP